MKAATTLGAATLLLSGLAIAGPNHNLVQVNYSTGDFDYDFTGVGAADIEQDGIKIEGSLVATDNILVRGSYAALTGDEGGVDRDVDTLVAGASWIISSNDNTDIDVGLEYRTDDLDIASTGSYDLDGAGLSFGVTSSVSETVDVSARLSWLGNEYDGAVSYDLNGTYYFAENMGLSLGYEFLNVDDTGIDAELSQVMLGLRVSF